MTLPTLQVMPSRVRDKLDSLGAAATEAWLKDDLGAVIVFDNEAGWVTVFLSERTEKEFSTVALSLMLQNRLLQARKKHLSPDKLEDSAMVLVSGLTELKLSGMQEARRHAVFRYVFLAVFLILGGCGWVAVRSRKPSSIAADTHS